MYGRGQITFEAEPIIIVSDLKVKKYNKGFFFNDTGL